MAVSGQSHAGTGPWVAGLLPPPSRGSRAGFPYAHCQARPRPPSLYPPSVIRDTASPGRPP